MNVLSDIVKRFLPAQQSLLFVINGGLLKEERMKAGTSQRSPLNQIMFFCGYACSYELPTSAFDVFKTNWKLNVLFNCFVPREGGQTPGVYNSKYKALRSWLELPWVTSFIVLIFPLSLLQALGLLRLINLQHHGHVKHTSCQSLLTTLSLLFPSSGSTSLGDLMLSDSRGFPLAAKYLNTFQHEFKFKIKFICIAPSYTKAIQSVWH